MFEVKSMNTFGYEDTLKRYFSSQVLRNASSFLSLCPLLPFHVHRQAFVREILRFCSQIFKSSCDLSGSVSRPAVQKTKDYLKSV